MFRQRATIPPLNSLDTSGQKRRSGVSLVAAPCPLSPDFVEKVAKFFAKIRSGEQLPIRIASLAQPNSQSHAQPTTTKDQLIGSWKVLTLKATTGDKVTDPLGEPVVGYVTITPRGFGYCSWMRLEKRQPHRR
jgi:hypothetical protein